MLDLKTLYLKATHPYPTIRKGVRPQFVLECRTLGPDRILRGIEEHVTNACPTPNYTSENIYNSYLQIFFDIENKFSGNFDEHLKGYHDYQSTKFGRLETRKYCVNKYRFNMNADEKNFMTADENF
uniref:Uncharacterized protein n=1 Tax=Meloidogyne incognita TaxID=6306 RepID=A0A914MQW4_MELIC